MDEETLQECKQMDSRTLYKIRNMIIECRTARLHADKMERRRERAAREWESEGGSVSGHEYEQIEEEARAANDRAEKLVSHLESIIGFVGRLYE